MAKHKYYVIRRTLNDINITEKRRQHGIGHDLASNKTLYIASWTSDIISNTTLDITNNWTSDMILNDGLSG